MDPDNINNQNPSNPGTASGRPVIFPSQDASNQPVQASPIDTTPIAPQAPSSPVNPAAEPPAPPISPAVPNQLHSLPEPATTPASPPEVPQVTHGAQPVEPLPTVAETPPAHTAAMTAPPPPPSQPLPSFAGPMQEPPPKRGKKGKLIAILVVLVLFLLTASSAGAYAIAYEKINLGIPAIERPITQFVLALPFTPKTPRMLLQSAYMAHRNVRKTTLNASIVVKSDSFSSFGLNQIDAEIKGGLDTTDPNNPMFSLNASVTKQFNVDIRKKDKIVYFKINKLPAMVAAFMKIDESKLQAVLENWIAWDTTPLQTEARQYLDNLEKEKKTDTVVAKPIDILFDENTLKAMKVSSDTLDNFKTYKIHLDATPSILDTIEKRLNEQRAKTPSSTLYQQKPTKLSDQIQNAKIDIWIDKNDHFMRKFVFAADFSTTPPAVPGVLGISDPARGPGGTKPKSKGSIVLALKLADFGQEVKVETPEKSVSPSEFYKMITSLVEPKSDMLGLNPTGQVDSAKDAQRKYDLKNLQSALELYHEDNTKYPSTLSQLQPKYIKIMPSDPDTKKPYQYIPTKDLKSYGLKAKLSTGEEYGLSTF